MKNTSHPTGIREQRWIVPMSAPDTGPAESEAVARVLASSQLSQGPFLDGFERRLGAFLGRRSAIAVSSGTAGLHLALRAAGVGSGDVVFTTSFSFVATANAVLYLGARPVFVDVDPRTGNLSPDRLRERMEREARTTPPERFKAILPVHVFGQPADMDAIGGVAREWGAAVVEDACEALGSERLGRKAGGFGDSAVFGFYPNKQVTTGEGGAIATDRPEWAELFRSWRNQGREGSGREPAHAELGYNYRLDEMSAALGWAQMARIEEIVANRARAAEFYRRRLEPLEGLQLPFIDDATTRISWFVYVVRFGSRQVRDFIRDFLARLGIPTRVYFEPIHLQPYYRRAGWGPTPELRETERLGEVSLALPFSGIMTERQVEMVTGCLKRGLRRFGV